MAKKINASELVNLVSDEYKQKINVYEKRYEDAISKFDNEIHLKKEYITELLNIASSKKKEYKKIFTKDCKISVKRFTALAKDFDNKCNEALNNINFKKFEGNPDSSETDWIYHGKIADLKSKEYYYKADSFKDIESLLKNI